MTAKELYKQIETFFLYLIFIYPGGIYKNALVVMMVLDFGIGSGFQWLRLE